ncbi:GNAT family N-acetyltransferase [Streptomyces griseoluteus]|uniref:GNAT family N-acetyltransferase n=1 Tax=Streptomyces griseoluteus TaxID=29306 RepID=UPI0036626920
MAEHVLATGHGTWWTDRAVQPRAVALTSGGHALLAGDPTVLTPADLAPLAEHCVEASVRFLPVFAAAFGLLQPWDRMLYVQRADAVPARVPRGTTVRRLQATDGPAIAAAETTLGWATATWGGPEGRARSGYGWAASRKGRILAVACTRFTGSRYEDLACATDPGERRIHLALACVAGLTADIAARGRTATWSCPRENRASRLLAWTAGFRLLREYVHHTTGPLAADGASHPRWSPYETLTFS